MLAQKWVTISPLIKSIVHSSHPVRIRAYGPSVIGWGAALGIFALHFLEITPLARKDIFSKLPIVGGFWQKKLEDAARAD